MCESGKNDKDGKKKSEGVEGMAKSLANKTYKKLSLNSKK